MDTRNTTHLHHALLEWFAHRHPIHWANSPDYRAGVEAAADMAVVSLEAVADRLASVALHRRFVFDQAVAEMRRRPLTAEQLERIVAAVGLPDDPTDGAPHA